MAEAKIKNFYKSLEEDPYKAIDGALAELNSKGGTDFKIGKMSSYFFGLKHLQNLTDNIERVNDMGKSMLMHAIMPSSSLTRTMHLPMFPCWYEEAVWTGKVTKLGIKPKLTKTPLEI